MALIRQFDLRVMHYHAPPHLKADIANLTLEHTDLIADFAARKGYFTSLASLTQSFEPISSSMQLNPSICGEQEI